MAINYRNTGQAKTESTKSVKKATAIGTVTIRKQEHPCMKRRKNNTPI